MSGIAPGSDERTEAREYTCAECGETFDMGWSEEEAAAEAIANGFGEIPDEDMAVVCDDCYKAIMAERGLLP